ncbi:MAG: tetratricopeptide repeat protein [Elusimicrobiota bacterium]
MKSRTLFFIIVVLFNTDALYAWPALKVNKGNKIYENGDFKEAESVYLEALAEKESARIYYNLANSYYNQGKLEEAEENYEKALSIAEDAEIRQKIYYNLGNVYFKKKRYAGSVASWKKMLMSDSADEDTRFNMEVALKLMRKKNLKMPQSKPKPKESDDEKKKKDKREAKNKLREMGNKIQKPNREKRKIDPKIRVEKDW